MYQRIDQPDMSAQEKYQIAFEALKQEAIEHRGVPDNVKIICLSKVRYLLQEKIPEALVREWLSYVKSQISTLADLDINEVIQRAQD